MFRQWPDFHSRYAGILDKRGRDNESQLYIENIVEKGVFVEKRRLCGKEASFPQYFVTCC